MSPRRSAIINPDTNEPFFLPNKDSLDPYSPGFVLPHVLSEVALLRGSSHTYFRERWDEAMRNSRENAMAMRRDEHLQACLRERVRGTTSLKWHLECDNPRDPWQAAVTRGVERIIRGYTYRLKDLQKWTLGGGLWFGRAGSQCRWKWENIEVPNPRAGGIVEEEKVKCLTLNMHLPVNGDKIDYTWAHVPMVQVNASKVDNYPTQDVILDNLGYSLVLGPKYRNRFIIHHWEPDDADFYDPERGSAVHGAGIRDWLYWSWWTKQEYMTNVADFLERYGLGFMVIYYDLGNEQAQQEALLLAKQYSRRAVLVVPRTPDGRHASAVEVVETPTNGMQILLALQQACEARQERFIIAQTLSSNHRGSGGLGGSGAAEFQANTKQEVIEDDALGHAGTMTGNEDHPGLVWMIQRWTYPWADFPVKWVYDTEPRDAEARMGIVSMAYNMGAEIPEKTVHELAAIRAPGPDDKVLRNPQIVAAEQQMQQQEQMAQQQAAQGQQQEQPQQEQGSGDPIFDKLFDQQGQQRLVDENRGNDISQEETGLTDYLSQLRSPQREQSENYG
jgi:hypothetical protein